MGEENTTPETQRVLGLTVLSVHQRVDPILRRKTLMSGGESLREECSQIQSPCKQAACLYHDDLLYWRVPWCTNKRLSQNHANMRAHEWKHNKGAQQHKHNSQYFGRSVWAHRTTALLLTYRYPLATTYIQINLNKGVPKTTQVTVLFSGEEKPLVLILAYLQ